MCLLTFLPAGVMPDTDALANGAVICDDGHGFAIVTADRILVQHGLVAEAMIDAFDTARREHPDGPALFHSRLSTHGTERDLANCHPFPLGGDTRTVIAHNGILPTAVQPKRGDPRSDTRIAAETFLPAFGPLRLRRNRLRVQRWMTAANKIVILTVDRRFRDRAYILNEQEGIWDGGIWYSNDGYLPYLPRRWDTRGALSRWPSRHAADWEPGRCNLCYALTDLTDEVCCSCGGCPICGEWLEDCACYEPAVLDRHFSAAQRRPNTPIA